MGDGAARDPASRRVSCVWDFYRGDLGSQFSGRFIPALLLSPVNYLQWDDQSQPGGRWNIYYAGLLGFFLVKDKRLRSFMFGLWGAYLFIWTVL